MCIGGHHKKFLKFYILCIKNYPCSTFQLLSLRFQVEATFASGNCSINLYLPTTCYELHYTLHLNVKILPILNNKIFQLCKRQFSELLVEEICYTQLNAIRVPNKIKLNEVSEQVDWIKLPELHRDRKQRNYLYRSLNFRNYCREQCNPSS